jgi:hypothetical protein
MAVEHASLLAVTQALSTDVATGEVTDALAQRGIPSVLLRGPGVARVLYPDSTRTYVDADLLVPPESWRAVGAVLSELGFAPLVEEHELAQHRRVHAFEWWRRRDHVAIDLHRTISGARVPDADVWRVLAGETRPLAVGGTQVQVLSRTAVAALVALHVAHHGPAHEKALTDLRRAIARLDEPTWRAAVALAERLDALSSLAAGLRLLPEGRRLADALALPAHAPIEVRLRASGSPPLALGLDWLLDQPGVLAKARLVVHVLAPPPGALRSWRARARAGRRGMALAYLTQPFWLARHALPSWRAVVKARKAVP